jgi:V/A-type H+-transporting ATPase subunit I
MAIEPVKKITVIAHKSLEDEVVDTLTRLGTVHIERVIDNEDLQAKELSEEEVQEARRVTFAIVQVEFILGFLHDNVGERPGFLSSMIKDKYYLTTDEFMRAGHRIDLDMLYAECSEFQRRLVAFSERKGRLEQERDELEHWVDLQIAMDELEGDDIFGLVLARINSLDLQSVLASLDEEAPESSLEVVGDKAPWASCLILYHPDSMEAVRSVLARHRCEIVQLPDLPDEPDERLEQVLREISAVDRRRIDLLELVEKYLDRVPTLEVLREYLDNERERIEVTTSFGVTRATVAVEGWVTERGVEQTTGRLAELSPELSVEIYDSIDGESPPVSLKNPDWIRPFELLVKLYGSPSRPEYDPTIVVAISFMIFFGFCIGDVGYGVVLVPTFLLMRKYLPLGKKAKDLLTILAWGAGAAIIVGVPTGGWFGIETQKLPHVLRSVAVMDGLNKTAVAMCVAIGIGLIHMLIGTGIEFRDNWRQGNRSDALIDQGLVFFLFVGGGIAVALYVAKIVPVAVPMAVAGAAIVLMLLLLGRSAKSIPGKAVNGLYETYGTVVGYVSDSISYVRLFALGLSTVIIALVVNNMAGLVYGVGPIIGIILMVLVLVVGHTFNIAINLLGAFVHPLRLEFVEFFGKFYDDGGREFKPLGIESKIVLIEDEEGL